MLAQSRKRQHLRSETVETQPNHHFPPVAPAQVLWFFCNRAIYEISSSLFGFELVEWAACSSPLVAVRIENMLRFRKAVLAEFDRLLASAQ